MHTTFSTGPGRWFLARLHSGHRRLNAHMHRKLKIVPSPTCSCGEEDQKTEHVLQICTRHQPERIAQRPSATQLHQKLYGDLEDLKKTTNFITAAGLVVWANEKKKETAYYLRELICWRFFLFQNSGCFYWLKSTISLTRPTQ
mgnify:CR=1 FL=1